VNGHEADSLDADAVGPSASASPTLIAYRALERPPLPIVPAGRWRGWMEEWWERWPNRCLPLLMANQAGWWILNTHGMMAQWDGRPEPDGLHVVLDDDAPEGPPPGESHFGNGILTFPVPYLFRTTPGWNLLARGPANLPKDGAAALEGLVETDWAVAPFTMNWKITRVGAPIRFEPGEPICQIVPQRRTDLESFTPRIADICEDPELETQIRRIAEQREQLAKLKFLARHVEQAEELRKQWQAHYFRGDQPDGRPAPEHQTKLRLAPFEGGTTSP
jgi:hypothetical protein